MAELYPPRPFNLVYSANIAAEHLLNQRPVYISGYSSFKNEAIAVPRSSN